VKWILFVIVVLLNISCGISQQTQQIPKDKQKAVDNYLNLAQAYYVSGSYEQAITPLKRASVIDPNSASVYGMLAMTYQALGEYKTAKQFFKQALAIKSSAYISSIRNNYAIFLLENKEHAAAYSEFAKVTEDLSYTNRSRTFENMGITAMRMHNYDQAIHAFNNALRLNDGLLVANKELASIYMQKNQPELALGYFRNFMAKNDKPAVEHYQLGINIAKSNGLNQYASELANQLDNLLTSNK
jgi:type IV pilus assembly protein PilF